MAILTNYISMLFTLINIRLLNIILCCLLVSILYPQKQTSIQPLSSKKSLIELNQQQLEVNPEYERVLQEYEKGFKYHDKVIRHAKVIVSE